MKPETCDRCGKPGAKRLGEQWLCADCYFEGNSCCGEFGGNDRSLPIQVVHGDITRQEVDAIVNAANRTLLGGGGVDGAIHRAAGPRLLAACVPLGGCKTGEAKLTPGFRLPAKYVIHTVGPVWKGGGKSEADLLASCYKRCLEIARDHDEIQSIAFPCISTGVYHFPKEEAAEIAVKTVIEFLQRHGKQLDVTFCCFSDADAEWYRRILC
ncbi:MAG: O-acetyl-ADP-ribose deacetylase [Verrucomicrobia bacterium]|nr:O-acetyl-ADP-ribose deacetylase [Verrucomicrobiota bacterium]